MDEIWGFVRKKEKHVTAGDDVEFGKVWTFCATDAESKLVPSFKVGDRDKKTATALMQDVKSRMANRIQISTDAFPAYVHAVETAFGADADYAQIIKVYGKTTMTITAGIASRI